MPLASVISHWLNGWGAKGGGDHPTHIEEQWRRTEPRGDLVHMGKVVGLTTSTGLVGAGLLAFPEVRRRTDEDALLLLGVL